MVSAVSGRGGFLNKRQPANQTPGRSEHFKLRAETSQTECFLCASRNKIENGGDLMEILPCGSYGGTFPASAYAAMSTLLVNTRGSEPASFLQVLQPGARMQSKGI